MKTKSTLANPNKNRSPRRRSREFALQALYQWLISQDDVSGIIEDTRSAHGFDKADADHFASLVSGTVRDAVALRVKIEPHLDRTFDELSPVEHAILLLGAHEFASHPDIPYRVVINEAVELTKSFGGVDGHKFVNGVLDKLAAKMRVSEMNADRNSKEAQT